MSICTLVVKLTVAKVDPVFAHLCLVVDSEVLNISKHLPSRWELHVLLLLVELLLLLILSVFVLHLNQVKVSRLLLDLTCTCHYNLLDGAELSKAMSLLTLLLEWLTLLWEGSLANLWGLHSELVFKVLQIRQAKKLCLVNSLIGGIAHVLCIFIGLS